MAINPLLFTVVGKEARPPSYIPLCFQLTLFLLAELTILGLAFYYM